MKISVAGLFFVVINIIFPPSNTLCYLNQRSPLASAVQESERDGHPFIPSSPKSRGQLQ